jgi:hypothetical protein
MAPWIRLGPVSGPKLLGLAVAAVLVVALAVTARRLASPAHEVGGVDLTPTSRAFQASCQQVADRVGFATLPWVAAHLAARQPATAAVRGQVGV